MSDEYTDPSGSTAQFQAFAALGDEPRRRSRGLIVALVIAAVVVLGVAALAISH